MNNHTDTDSHPHSHDHHGAGCHGGSSNRPDWFLWSTALIVAAAYGLYWLVPQAAAQNDVLEVFTESVFDLVNTIWWGVLIGMVTIGILSRVPKEFVISILGPGGSAGGIIRATLGGVLLDLCSHGILMVGAKLYERGASTGQVMAFLIASPWNSLSLTLILIALIGLPWTLAFLILSMGIAIASGLVFEAIEGRGYLPSNPNRVDLPEDFHLVQETKRGLKNTRYNTALLRDIAINGLKESRMVMRWILFGLILAGLVRAFLSPETFGTYFGPTLIGLGLTLVVATILEVCSEGSIPVAADLLTRAGAPGNSFAFLMTGVATDYTEIMILREATKSWKIPLFLPLVTVPQIVTISWLINTIAAG